MAGSFSIYQYFVGRMCVEMETVSVIIPTYNREDTIVRAIDSVLCQTYEALEVIVVDDGSVDGTEERVIKIPDSRVKYIKCKENGGVSRARNIGVLHAENQWIAFHDSDDIWLKHKLQKQMEFLDCHKEAQIVYCSYRFHGIKGEQLFYPQEWIPDHEKTGYIFPRLLCGNLVGTPTIVMNKKVWQETGGFDETLTSLEDFEFALRVAQKHNIYWVDEILYEAYQTEGSVNHNRLGFYKTWLKVICQFKQDYIKYGLLEAVLEFLVSAAKEDGCLEMVLELLNQII